MHGWQRRLCPLLYGKHEWISNRDGNPLSGSLDSITILKDAVDANGARSHGERKQARAKPLLLPLVTASTRDSIRICGLCEIHKTIGFFVICQLPPSRPRLIVWLGPGRDAAKDVGVLLDHLCNHPGQSP